MSKRLLFTLLLSFPLLFNAQNSKWNAKFSDGRAFVENKGQYDDRNWQKSNKIKYALSQQDGWFTFFTEKGITHRFEELIRNPNKKKGEVDKPSRIHKSELVDIFFVNGNSNVKIIAEDKTDHYYSYAVKDLKTNEVSNINKVYGNKKITYKNIYNNIDVEYTLHPDGGIKYNIILHPGANPNDIQLKYVTKHTNVKGENINIHLNNNGELEINTSNTKVIEHKPVTFYAGSKTPINSSYTFSNNILSFNLANYDNSQKVIIDPWVVTPNFNAGDFTREVETDAAGNVYVIGGEIPMELRKYDALGNFIWTYVTPWDTNGGDWLGTLATDAAGVSYITQGTGPEIERVSTAGAMVWHNNAPFLHEYWTITFNCDNTKLIVGGTDVIPFNYRATIWDIDLNNGNQLANVTVGTQGGFSPIEVRSIAPTKNSKYVYLTHTEVGAINQNLTACSSTPDFEVDNTHHLAYKCENYLSSAQNGGGLKALIANDNYYYTHRGDQILQWDINTGALLNTVALPGGSSNAGFGGRVVHCSGLDVDATGNVYAGSMDRVVKFDANLNILASANTSGGFTVYDVSVNSNGEVVAVGALLDNGTSTGRGGRIESLVLTAGSQYATICCDPNFCPIGQVCVTDPPINLNPNTPGGVWTSNPSTAGLNATTGVFDPSVAGVGTYTITYTLGCGSYSTVIQVGNCSSMSVCVEANGDLTVTGGTGPYTWDEWVAATSTPITNQTQCTACGGTWVAFPGACFNPIPIPMNNCNTPAGWSNFANGTTVTPPVGGDTIKVTDSFGDTLVIFNINNLPPCTTSPCDATISPAGPFCLNDPAINLTAVDTGGTWTGTGITNANNGTFDPSTAGVGSHTITYTLPTCSDTVIIVVNPQDNAAFTYPSGSYCLTDPDPLPTITGTTGGTFTIDNSGSINASSGLINLTASGVGSYVVTYITNGTCPDTATFNISIVNSADATINAAGPFCEDDPSTNLSAAQTGGTWSGNGITNTTNGTFDPATAGAGNHQIIYTITGSCGDADTISIVVNPRDTATFAYSSGSYCLTDPNPLPTGIVTTGGTFTINNGGTINAGTGEINISGSGLGNYIITYITNGSCPDTATFNVNIINCTVPPTASFSSTDSTICAGDCIDFNELSTGAATGWSWQFFGAATTTSSAQNPTNICYNTAGTYDVSLTVTDGTNSDSLFMPGFITVNPSDTAAFTYPSGSYCLTDPDPSPLNTGTSGGTYSIDNGGVINNSTGVIDITGSGIGSYTVTYITSGSCPDTATFNINIVTSTDATITQAGPFCENDPAVNLVAVDPGGNWTGNGITNATNGTFDPATAGAGNHVITYTISGSCGDVDSITIVVNPSDDASFSYSPTTFCDTDVNPLPTGIVTTGGTFTIDNGGTINGATGEINLAASGAGSYVITYITSGTCPDTNTFSITITTCTVPTAVYTVSDSAICDGDCVTFTDMSTGATAWQWTFTGGNPATANTQGPHTVCFTGPGTYNIELIASNSSGTDTTTSTVEVFANPTVDAGVDVTIDLGQSTTLNATGTNGNYAWTPPTWLSCPTCSTTTATPEETTTYSVTVVDSNGCSVSDNVTVFVDFEYVIWVPNIFSPNGDGSNDIAFVRGVGVETLNFMIYDRWGEKVFETTDLNIGWDGTFRGKKMNNAVFVYYLEATFKNGASTTKKGDITLVR